MNSETFLSQLGNAQKQYFQEGITQSFEFRQSQLLILKGAIEAHLS